jgi:hypothetical protein
VIGQYGENDSAALTYPGRSTTSKRIRQDIVAAQPRQHLPEPDNKSLQMGYTSQEEIMTAPEEKKEKPDPERVAVLRSLPLEVKEKITGEEAAAFMYNRPLPESLLEKLKDYIVIDKEE